MNIFEIHKENQCKGHFFTYRENFYIGGRGELVSKITFTPLKRASCGGCEHCGGIPDMIDCEIGNGCMIPYPVNLRDGEVVELISINDGRCFEDIYDEWHLEFSKTTVEKGNESSPTTKFSTN